MDMEKLKKAIIYVDRIANGNNPVNNELMDKDCVLNNPNVIRCMYFIKDVLKEVYLNKGITKRNKIKEKFDYNLLKDFKYIEDKSISHLIKQINDLSNNEDMENLRYKVVVDYLKSNNYLGELLINTQDDKTKNKTIITDKGKKLGIYYVSRISVYGREYDVIMYNKNAQEFIVNNLINIYEGE